MAMHLLSTFLVVGGRIIMMKKLFLLIGLIVFSSFSINADVTDSEFIEKHKDEIQNFISESGCFLKDINEYEIGVLNFENTNLTKSEKIIYLSYKHCNLFLIKPSAEGMELLLYIDPHYAIFDIKVEDFFNNNSTYLYARASFSLTYGLIKWEWKYSSRSIVKYKLLILTFYHYHL